MARHERHGLARACPATAGSLRKRCALCLGGGEPREPARRQPARVEHQSAAVDQSDDAQREPLTLDLRDHRRQRATDLAESQQHDVGTLGLRHGTPADLGELERRVHGPLGACRVPAVDHEREIELRRALRRRDHVDASLGEGGKYAGRDPRRAGHAEPHHHERREPAAELDAVDLLTLDLALERLLEALPRALGALGGNAEADRVLGGRLADEGDGDPLVVDGGECSRRDAGHAQHPAARHREQCLARNGRERLHGILLERPAARDLGAERRRIGERPNADRDRALEDRNERARVQYLRAVVGELRGLAYVDLRDHARVRHDPGVRREQARHVLPERDLPGPEHPGEQRGGEIRAAAPERGHLAVGRRPQEPGDDRHRVARQEGREDAARGAFRAPKVR